MRGQLVVGREQVVQIALARHRLALRLGAGMPAQVEGQAGATQCGDLARARQVLLLASAPAMHEEHAGHQRAGQDERPGDGPGAATDVDLLLTNRHRDAPPRTW